MQIHLVVAESGDYSDRSIWYVAAYTDEALAQQHVEKASERSREYEQLNSDERWELEEGDFYLNNGILPKWSKWDPKLRPYSSEGPNYALETLPLLSQLPAAIRISSGS